MSMIGYFLKADDLLVRQIEDGNAGEILFGEEEEQELLCIDKAWHAIHYVLTGCVWDIPDDNILGQMILGGEPVSDEDFGYGPARLIPKEIVAQIADALKEWDEAAFRDKFCIEDLISNEIYPVTSNEDGELFAEYVWENFAELKKYFETAAKDGESMVTFLG